MAAILIIEDDVLIARCYKDWLAAAAHEVYIATRASEAIDVLLAHPIDVIMLDIHLPGHSGINVAHMLQSYPAVADIPIIVCTNAELPKRVDWRTYGVCEVLKKPTVTRQLLCAAIERALR